MMYTYSFLKSIVKAKSVALLISPITMTINKNSKNRTIQQRNKSETQKGLSTSMQSLLDIMEAL